MSINALLTTTATLRRVQRATVDTEGNPVRSKTTSTVRCHYEQTGGSGRNASGESQGDHLDVDTRFRVYLPAGTAVGPLDELVIGTQVFEVVGEPWDVINPRRGTVSHIEAWMESRTRL